MLFRSVAKLFAVLVLAGTLAACEDSESRAERYYQSGLALLEEGDVERALIEFRNVFNLNGAHREARSTYARVVREQGNIPEASGQYLRLVEFYPDDLEGRIALSEMAFLRRDLEEFERHSVVAIELAPQDPRVQAIEVAGLYQKAVRDENGPAREVAFDKAVALIKDQPDNMLLQQIEIDGHLQNEDFTKVLDAIDRASETNPDNRLLAEFRLEMLGKLQDIDGYEAQLRYIVTTFPVEDNTYRDRLIGLYLSRDEADKAEAFLREISDPNAEDSASYRSLIWFIDQQRGAEAAIAELDQVIPTLDNPGRYQAMRAGILFNQGKRDTAIADLEAAIAATEPSEQQRVMKVILADMLQKISNEVGARQLVEQVLAEDPTQVAALRMSAAWQIQAGDTDQAINTLRTALDQAPQDVASMTLMAQAYIKADNRDLARDFLSLAVDASDQAPAQTLTYARFLNEEARHIPAEQALVASLRKEQNRTNLDLLVALGQTYLLMDDQPRLRQVIDQIRRLDTDNARKAAAGLEAALIQKQSGTKAAADYLEEISKDWDDALAAQVKVIRARLATGDLAGALTSAENMLAEDPTDPKRRAFMATTQAAVGKLDEAEAGYRGLLTEDPVRPGIWFQLYRILAVQGDIQAATQALTDGIAANPKSPELLWARASQLEREGDIEGAIAVYEALYTEESQSVIISNNLASLLATHRDDAESLERAATVARPLRGLPQVAFRDTWGWIAFRQGDLQDALEHLEPAARGLANDALVQYHLGRTYEALDRKDEAIAQYEKVLEIAGPDDTRASIVDARTRLEALK